MVEFKGRTLDRIPQFDDRSRGFAAIAPDDTRPFRNRRWTCEPYLDQGREGACVGFSLAHELAAKPKTHDVTEELALSIYKRAKQIDPWDGEDYSGTSVLAGVKAVQEMKNSAGKPFIGEYRWAFGFDDVLRVIGYHGPVVLGIEWQEAFYNPDANGKIWLDNKPVGGHAILAVGVDIVPGPGVDSPSTFAQLDHQKTLIRLHNSWGTDYGDGGDCYISAYDLRHLLEDKDGEACVPMKRARQK